MPKIVKPTNSASELNHGINCFGCSPSNNKGLKADFTFDQERGKVLFYYKLREEYEGAPKHAHGGILATLIDEAQGALCQHIGWYVMTDRLTIHYRKAVPIGEELLIEAFLTKISKKRIYTQGRIQSKTGMVHVNSKASFYVLNARLFHRLYKSATPQEKEKLKEAQEKTTALMEANRKRFKLLMSKQRKKIRPGVEAVRELRK